MHIWYIMLEMEREISVFKQKLENAKTEAEVQALTEEFQKLERAYDLMKNWLLAPLQN